MKCSLLLLVAVVVVSIISSTAAAFNTVPKFTLDLDLPPHKRWDGAIDLVVKKHGWDNSIGNIVSHYMSHVGGLPEAAFDILKNMTKELHPEMYGEVSGIITQLEAYGFQNSTKFYALLYGYELSHSHGIRSGGGLSEMYAKSCTGILSLPANKSAPMLHGRNMDKKPASCRNATLHITVVKGGEVLYEVFDWTWVTSGFATSARRGGVTLEDNWRMGTYKEPLEIVAMLLNGAVPMIRAQRHVQENKLNFTEALHFYNTSFFASPFYVIMSGEGRQGAVLALDWNATDNVVDILNDDSKQSFMIETNYDRWKPDPPSDPRRTVAHDALMSLEPHRRGEKLGVWMALSTYPVHNPDTLYSTLMTIGDGDDSKPLIEGYTRTPMKPTTEKN